MGEKKHFMGEGFVGERRDLLNRICQTIMRDAGLRGRFKRIRIYPVEDWSQWGVMMRLKTGSGADQPGRGFALAQKMSKRIYLICRGKTAFKCEKRGEKPGLALIVHLSLFR